MKRLWYVVLVCVCLSLAFCACGKKADEASEGKEIAVQEKSDIEKYISSLSSELAMRNFEAFWSSVQSYGDRLVRALGEIKNTGKYEFDPTDDSAIPSELKDAFDFSILEKHYDYKNHKDFNVVIDGEDVYLSFDGKLFYPSEYSVLDIKEFVENSIAALGE